MSNKIYFLRRSLMNPVNTQLIELIEVRPNKYKSNRIFVFGQNDISISHFKYISFVIKNLMRLKYYKQLTKEEFVKQLLLFDYKEVHL